MTLKKPIRAFEHLDGRGDAARNRIYPVTLPAGTELVLERLRLHHHPVVDLDGGGQLEVVARARCHGVDSTTRYRMVCQVSPETVRAETRRSVHRG